MCLPDVQYTPRSIHPDANLSAPLAAGCFVVTIPIVALFMFLQRYCMEGVTAGSVKGWSAQFFPAVIPGKNSRNAAKIGFPGVFFTRKG